MKKIFLAVLFSLTAAGGLRAQEPAPTEADPYREAIIQLIELTDMQRSFEAVIPQLFDMVREQAPQVPAEFWDSAERKFLDQAMDETLKIMLPLYKAHFTPEDLQGLIQFYKSPLGQKMIAAQSDIALQSMEAGQAWGMRILQELVTEIQEKGYTSEM